jgi:hypothetical protein
LVSGFYKAWRAAAFADLGEAVRKIRIDFGIPIEFGPMSIYPRSAIRRAQTAGRNCAIGRIRYSMVDGADAPDGVIVYIKPACYGDEPRDIYAYFKRNKTFPHESTTDHFFPSRNLRAIACWACTRWKNFAQIATGIFAVSFAKF